MPCPIWHKAIDSFELDAVELCKAHPITYHLVVFNTLTVP